MERRPWEACSRSTPQELRNTLRNSRVYYRVRKRPPIVPILSQVNPIHTLPFYFFTIHTNIILPPTFRSSWWSLPFYLAHQYHVCIPLLPYECYISCLSHPLWLNNPNYIWRRVQVMELLIMHFLQPLIISSVLGPNCLLSTLFSNILGVCSSLTVRDQVSHPYRPTGRFIVLSILTFTLLDSRREGLRFRTYRKLLIN
jgi:hypothetical protein